MTYLDWVSSHPAAALVLLCFATFALLASLAAVIRIVTIFKGGK